jgi:hypothetical protein
LYTKFISAHVNWLKEKEKILQNVPVIFGFPNIVGRLSVGVFKVKIVPWVPSAALRRAAIEEQT